VDEETLSSEDLGENLTHTKGVSQAEQTPANGAAKDLASAQGEEPSPSEVLTKISGFLTLFASLAGFVYVLGLFVLWVPIARTYTGDFVTAWHATSLVPRTVVAGLGVEQLMAFPLTIVTLLVVVTAVSDKLAAPLRSAFGKVGTIRKRNDTKVESSFAAEESISSPLKYLVAMVQSPGHTRRYMSYLPTVFIILLYAAWRIHYSPSPILSVSILRMALIIFLAVQSFSRLFGTLPIAIAGTIRRLVRQRQTKNWPPSHLVVRLIIGVLVAAIGAAIFLAVYLVPLYLVFPEPQYTSINVASVTNALIVVIAAFTVWTGGFIAVDSMLLYPNEQRPYRSWLRMQRRPRLFGFVVMFCSALLAAFMLTIVNKPPLPTVKINGKQSEEGKLLTHTDGYWYVFDGENELIAIPDSEVDTVRVSTEGG
jgi:hypothetical protein